MYNYYQQQNQQLVQPQFSTIYGQIVDGYETAKNQSVPFGAYAVFPKGDMSAVYVKSWKNDGSTQTITYVPETIVQPEDKAPYIDVLDQIQKSVDELCRKLDSSSATRQTKKTGGTENG